MGISMSNDVVSYSVKGAAQATGVSRDTIYVHIGTNRLKSFKLNGRRLIRKVDLVSFVDQLFNDQHPQTN